MLCPFYHWRCLSFILSTSSLACFSWNCSSNSSVSRGSPELFKIGYLASFITIFPKVLELASFSIRFLTKSTAWSHRCPLFWTNVQICSCLPFSLFFLLLSSSLFFILLLYFLFSSFFFIFSLPFSICLSSPTYSFQTRTFWGLVHLPHDKTHLFLTPLPQGPISTSVFATPPPAPAAFKLSFKQLSAFTALAPRT